MFTSFTITNFRCFDKLTIGPLAKVNLIAGKNNVGKTALLEALWLHHGGDIPELSLRVNTFRGIETVSSNEALLDLFNDFDPYKTIELKSLDETKAERSLTIHLSKEPVSQLPLSAVGDKEAPMSDAESATSELLEKRFSFDYLDPNGRLFQSYGSVSRRGVEFQRASSPARPLGVFLHSRRASVTNPDIERFGKLEVAGKQQEVVETLKLIEPRLSRLATILAGSKATIQGDIGIGRLIPLPLMGDGMTRLLSLTLAIAEAKGGLVVVDEIENGLHYSVLTKVWRAIAASARQFNVQIFATTHSHEAVEAAYTAFAGDKSTDFRLHRLDRVDNTIRAVTYDLETLGTALETGLEVR